MLDHTLIIADLSYHEQAGKVGADLGCCLCSYRVYFSHHRLLDTVAIATPSCITAALFAITSAVEFGWVVMAIFI